MNQTKRADLAASYREALDACWRVQFCAALDFFDTCSVSIEQWLSVTDEYDGRGGYVDRYVLVGGAFAAAAALFASGRDGELRHAPRVVYDPRGDQFVFLFKLENNGSVVLVSRRGVDLSQDRVFEYAVVRPYRFDVQRAARL